MKKQLRVGIVGPCPPPHGGVTRVLSNHLSFWSDEPVESWVIPLAVPDAPEVYPGATLIDHRDHRRHFWNDIGAALRLGPRLALMKPATLKNLFSFDAALRRAIRDHRFDILYAHHSSSIGMTAVIEARRAGIPVVLVAYGECWLVEEADQLWKKAIEYSVSQATWVVSTSDHCRKGAIARGASPDRSSVIYAGIDLTHFRPALDGLTFRRSHGIPEDAVVVSVLGLALRRKLDTLLEALPVLLQESNAYVLIGGAGKDAAYLKERIDKLGSDRVKALGFVPEAELPVFYNATDILVVSPRTLVECMGQSMKEAMACGRVVVGPRLGGVPEAVENGRSGMFFEPDNPQDLVRVLRELAADPERRRAMGERGRAIAEQKFDAAVSARQTLDLFHRLVLPR